MYSGGFYPYQTLEEHWAYWSRYIYINRYRNASRPVYEKLYVLVKDKDYFVLTTNVDHCFQKAGFDKHRLFYTQGDYGLFQCSRPCHQETYDNEQVICEMVAAQGYGIGTDGELMLPEDISPKMWVPTELIPHCPKCGSPMSMNLRADDTFVEDEGWHLASKRYADFLRRHRNMKVLFLELAVGYNTPGIIKYPFWRQAARWENAELLASCYHSCLELAEQNGVRSVAFCCISTGVFMFPNERAAEIAVETVRKYYEEIGSEMKVVFDVFKEEDLAIYSRILSDDMLG